jgi:hypothetical protein
MSERGSTLKGEIIMEGAHQGPCQVLLSFPCDLVMFIIYYKRFISFEYKFDSNF